MKIDPGKYGMDIDFQFEILVDKVQIVEQPGTLIPINVLDSSGNPIVAYQRERWVPSIRYITLNGVTVSDVSIRTAWKARAYDFYKMGILEFPCEENTDGDNYYSLKFRIQLHSVEQVNSCAKIFQDFLKEMFDVEVEIK